MDLVKKKHLSVIEGRSIYSIFHPFYLEMSEILRNVPVNIYTEVPLSIINVFNGIIDSISKHDQYFEKYRLLEESIQWFELKLAAKAFCKYVEAQYLSQRGLTWPR